MTHALFFAKVLSYNLRTQRREGGLAVTKILYDDTGRGGVSRHTPKITTSFNVHAPYSTKFHQFLKKSSMQNEYKKRVCLFLVVFFSAFFSFLFSAPYSLLISPFSFILHNLTKSAIFKVWFFLAISTNKITLNAIYMKKNAKFIWHERSYIRFSWI